MSERVTVEIDSKEPKPFYDEVIYQASINEKFFHFRFVRKGLKVGDIKCQNLGVERKTIEDFVSSIKDGRVFKQMENMANNYKFAYLFISGNLESLYNETFIKSILTSCADFEFRYNIRIRFLPNDEYLAWYFLSLCLKHSTELEPLYELHRPKVKHDEQAVMCLMVIDKVGKKTAKALLLHKGSLRSVLNSTAEELMETPDARIGAVIAERIVQVANKKFSTKKTAKKRRKKKNGPK